MQQRPQPIIVFLLIGMAAILALGLFLIVLYIQNRPEVPEGTELQIVEGVEVRVNPDPAKEVVIVQPVVVEQPITEPQPAPADPAVQEPAPEIVAVAPTETPMPQVAATAAPPLSDSVIFIDYAVQPSDTLYSIAKRMDTSIALMSRFGISAKELVPGQVIRLPIGNPAYCAPRRPYAVTEGDTAFGIARRHGISAEELRTINALDANYTIYTATIICVP